MIGKIVFSKSPKQCLQRAQFLGELRKAKKTIEEYEKEKAEEEKRKEEEEKKAEMEEEEEEEEEEDPDAVVGEESVVEHANASFKNMKKMKVTMEGLYQENIAFSYVQCVKCSIVCDDCQSQFDTLLTLLDTKSRLLTHQAACPKCTRSNVVIFNYSWLHMQNTSLVGCFVQVNATVTTIVACNFNLSCESCDTGNVLKGTIPGEQREINCMACFKKMGFVYQTMSMEELLQNEYDAQFGSVIQSRMNTVQKSKREDGSGFQIKVGQALPNNGICKHYKKSNRWMRFPCCAKVYACDICHDDKSDHACEWAKTIICGFCSKEQSQKNGECTGCGKKIGSTKAGTFWNGGKGTRNKQTMSRSDNKKFKGTCKTQSNKSRLLNKKKGKK